jgi:hypothetical protein
MNTINTISSHLVPESDRLAFVDKLFGINYVLKLEPAVFRFAEQLAAPAYNGGYWQFFALSNGSFYMAPRSDTMFAVSCENGFEGNFRVTRLALRRVCMPTATCRSARASLLRAAQSTTTFCSNTYLDTMRCGPFFGPLTDRAGRDGGGHGASEKDPPAPNLGPWWSNRVPAAARILPGYGGVVGAMSEN